MISLLKNSCYAVLLFITSSSAADISSLTKLYKSNYNNFYKSRLCGQNTARLVKAAIDNNIDLSNSYVLKVEGGGFLETSAFYSRGKVDERVMIGYFHMVLVADGYVFDFDLNEPLVLKIADYVRLQFTPPFEPFIVYGINYSKKGNPGNWSLTGFRTEDYAYGSEVKIFKKKMSDLIDLDKLRNRRRIR